MSARPDILDNPKQAKFLPVPVQRRDRDLRDGIVPEGTRMRVTDAVRPLLEGVRRLGASLDRLTELVEAKRRAKAEAESERRLDAIRAYLQRPIKAGLLQTDGRRRPWRLKSTVRDEEGN
jgi:hypothetical protein